MTKPLWENEQVEIHEDSIDCRYKDIYWIEVERVAIEADPLICYRMFCHTANPDLLYEAFLQLATYWGLKVDFDELRKIRDEMKEKSE